MPMKPLYQVLAALVVARENCAKSGNVEWYERHKDHAEKLVKGFMPSGSGFDAGTHLLWAHSTPECLRFATHFHHHNDSGYVGWTNHIVTVRPSLAHSFVLKVSGRNLRDIKDYIHDTFQQAFHQEVEA